MAAAGGPGATPPGDLAVWRGRRGSASGRSGLLDLGVNTVDTFPLGFGPLTGITSNCEPALQLLFRGFLFYRSVNRSLILSHWIFLCHLRLFCTLLFLHIRFLPLTSASPTLSSYLRRFSQTPPTFSIHFTSSCELFPQLFFTNCYLHFYCQNFCCHFPKSTPFTKARIFRKTFHPLSFGIFLNFSSVHTLTV